MSSEEHAIMVGIKAAGSWMMNHMIVTFLIASLLTVLILTGVGVIPLWRTSGTTSLVGTTPTTTTTTTTTDEAVSANDGEFTSFPFRTKDTVRVKMYPVSSDPYLYTFSYSTGKFKFRTTDANVSGFDSISDYSWNLQDEDGNDISAVEDSTVLDVSATEFYAKTGEVKKVIATFDDGTTFVPSTARLLVTRNRTLELWIEDSDGTDTMVYEGAAKLQATWVFSESFGKGDQLKLSSFKFFLNTTDDRFTLRDTEDDTLGTDGDFSLESKASAVLEPSSSAYLTVVDDDLIMKDGSDEVVIYSFTSGDNDNVGTALPTKSHCRLRLAKDRELAFLCRTKNSVFEDDAIYEEVLHEFGTTNA